MLFFKSKFNGVVHVLAIMRSEEWNGGVQRIFDIYFRNLSA